MMEMDLLMVVVMIDLGQSQLLRCFGAERCALENLFDASVDG